MRLLTLCLLGGNMGCTVSTYSNPKTHLRTSSREGVYHKVQRGETIWRIAQIYQVDLEEIIRSNHIPNAAHIEENQLIFIPGVDDFRDRALSEEEFRDREFSWPLSGSLIHYFGERKGVLPNRGIGIAASEGQTVNASRAGEVIFADYLSGYGYTVILDHQDGYSSVYARNTELLVQVGHFVHKGQAIARIGKFGDQVYLHFEIRKKAVTENPLYYLPEI